MANEFCPKCHTLSSMNVSSIERDEKDNEGKPLKVKTTSYHCSICHTFVRSEDEKTPLKL